MSFQVSQLVNKMCSQQACGKLCQQVVTMLLFYQVATRLSLATCWQIVESQERQDDNKLLEQLVTSLLSTTTLFVSTSWERFKQCELILLTSCWNSIHCYQSAAGLLQLVRTSCYRSANKLLQLGIGLMALSDLLQGCSNKSDTVMI
jgi:hypothetical protein